MLVIYIDNNVFVIKATPEIIALVDTADWLPGERFMVIPGTLPEE